MNDKAQACGSVSSDQLGHAPRWYCLSADGMATLCKNEEDAKEVAAESWVLYPQNAPYRAAQMVDASAVAAERERICAAIKAADDKAIEGDYMLDSEDCIKVARGEWCWPEQPNR